FSDVFAAGRGTARTVKGNARAGGGVWVGASVKASANASLAGSSLVDGAAAGSGAADHAASIASSPLSGENGSRAVTGGGSGDNWKLKAAGWGGFMLDSSTGELSASDAAATGDTADATGSSELGRTAAGGGGAEGS